MDLDELTQDPEKLRKILSYHVVVGQKLVPENLTEGRVLYTDNGDQRLKVVGVNPVTISRGAAGQDAKVTRYIDNGNDVSTRLYRNKSLNVGATGRVVDQATIFTRLVKTC